MRALVPPDRRDPLAGPVACRRAAGVPPDRSDLAESPQLGDNAAEPGNGPHPFASPWRTQMAKGQVRSNKEKKKPKQSKKPSTPAVPFGTDKSKTPPAK